MKQLAYNKEGEQVHIKEAVKNETYYNSFGDELITKQGDVLTWHYALKNGEYTGLTALHEDAIMYWCNVNRFELDEFIIEPFKTVPNKKRKEFRGLEPDAVMYDKDGNVLGWLEIEVTHANTKDKINYVYENNIICINFKYGRKSNYKEPSSVKQLPIKIHDEIDSCTKDIEEIENQDDRTRKQIQHRKRSIEFRRSEIEKGRGEIREGERRLSKEGASGVYAESRRDKYRGEIRKLKEKTERIQQRIYESKQRIELNTGRRKGTSTFESEKNKTAIHILQLEREISDLC